MVVGIPGLLLALLVSRMKEPVRGMSEGGSTPWTTHAHPFRETGHELLTVLPGINFLCLIAQRASAGLITTNLVAALASAATFFSLYQWLGNPGQWIALGVAVYCALTWGQSLRVRKREVFRAIFPTPTVVLSCIAFPLMSLVSYGTGFWIIPYILRAYHVSATQVGVVVGLGAIGALPTGIAMMYAQDLTTVYVLFFVFTIFTTMYNGPAYATINDLVLPHMRGTVTALCLLATTLIGLALGPYITGVISTKLSEGGMNPIESLRRGVLALFVFDCIAIVLLLIACRTIGRDQARIRELAAAG